MRKKREFYRGNSFAYYVLVSRDKDFHFFFMLLYLFPKQIFNGKCSQRSEAINKHSWKNARTTARVSTYLRNN